MGREERAADLQKKRHCVEVIWDNLQRLAVKDIERRRRKVLYAGEPKKPNSAGELFEGMVIEPDFGVDLEFVYLLLRLFESEIIHMEEIRNPTIYKKLLLALRLQACLACLTLYRKAKPNPLMKNCLFRITALVEDAGDDPDKLGYAIKYLSKLECRNRKKEKEENRKHPRGYWGYLNSMICPLKNQQWRFRDINKKISRDFFPERYDLLNHLRSLASSFKPPMINRKPFNNLLYFKTPAKWYRMNKGPLWMKECVRNVYAAQQLIGGR